MAQEVNYTDLLELLVEKTSSGLCKWEKTNTNNEYRLLLKNGSVVFKTGYNHVIDEYSFRLRLYDLKSNFAELCYSQSEIDNPDEKNKIDSNLLYNLYEAITDNENRIMNSKVMSLVNDIQELDGK